MFMKKWWLEFTAEDGRRWSGWINTTASKKEYFPETIKGKFYTYKDEEGAHGEFELDDGKRGYIVTNCMLPPEYSAKSETLEELYKAFKSLSRLNKWERFDKRVEDCLVLDKTYIIEY